MSESGSESGSEGEGEAEGQAPQQPEAGSGDEGSASGSEEEEESEGEQEENGLAAFYGAKFAVSTHNRQSTRRQRVRHARARGLAGACAAAVMPVPSSLWPAMPLLARWILTIT